METCGTVAMDDQNIIWIKKEETDGVPDEPGLMFLEDPVKTEMPGLPTKPDPEMKFWVDCSDNNVVKNSLEISWASDFIKEDPGLNLEEDETDNFFLEDPLKTEVPGVPIKPDPEMKLHVDNSENNEAASRYAFNSTRSIQNNGKTHGISFEETVMQGFAPIELEIHAEESAHGIMFGTHAQGLQEEVEKEEDESLFCTRLKCSWRENEFPKFRCNSCLQSFSSKYRLIMHVFIHMSGLQPPTYICKSCGEIFSSDIGLNIHLKMNEGDQASSTGHNDKNDYIYKHENIFLDSDEKFSVIEETEKQPSSQLKRKAYKCDVCGKSTTRLSYLKKHALIHKGIKPHKCNICDKAFTVLGNLKTHALRHAGIRRRKCDVCGKSFTDLSDLKRHVSIHTQI